MTMIEKDNLAFIAYGLALAGDDEETIMAKLRVYIDELHTSAESK